ncbi:MAG TPA: glycosyltransferase family 2 protein [Tepidisphaeraceae bacterium]|nr:glycosyltransferase family 2 protein [Tepidisphaeraceae bacterium]
MPIETTFLIGNWKSAIGNQPNPKLTCWNTPQSPVRYRALFILAAPNLFIAYFLLGPFVWFGSFILMAFGWARVNRLRASKDALPENPPPVTILVPAKDEEGGIAGCIERIAEQDYPNFDIIAVDDRSTDRTGVILDELSVAATPASPSLDSEKSDAGVAATKKLQVLHIPIGGLPAGWLGKCHALSKAEKLATGDWLLFVDSDVSLQPDALSRTLALAIQRKYDAISIITRLECSSFWERLMLPLLGGTWTMMYFTSLTNRNHSKVAVANGQFFLIRREAYEKVGGHEAVRNQITEDVELMRLLKSEEFIVRFFLGGHLASTHMHSNLRQMFHGWGRIFSGTSRRSPVRILLTMLFFIFCGFSAYPAIVLGALHGQRELLIASLAHLSLMTTYLAVIYGMSGNPKRYAWLFPIAGTMMLAIFSFALRMCYTGKLKWRDTQYGAELTNPKQA